MGAVTCIVTLTGYAGYRSRRVHTFLEESLQLRNYLLSFVISDFWKEKILSFHHIPKETFDSETAKE